MANLTLEQANSLLPSVAHGSIPNPLKLIYTLIAEPKWGKSTWFSTFPDSVLVAFEQGQAFIEAKKVVIDAWAAKNSQVTEDDEGLRHMTFVDFVDAICASDMFKFVIIDTADMAARMCVDYNCTRLGITHPSDMEYGKGYDQALNAPFRQLIGRIAKSGRGIGFITHTEIKDSRFTSGTKARKECSLPGGVVKFIIPQSDMVLHGKFGSLNKQTGKRDRILVTEGSDDMLAGSRAQGKYRMPSRFIVDPVHPWQQWESFFNDPDAAEAAEAAYNKSIKKAKAEPEESDAK